MANGIVAFLGLLSLSVVICKNIASDDDIAFVNAAVGNRVDDDPLQPNFNPTIDSGQCITNEDKAGTCVTKEKCKIDITVPAEETFILKEVGCDYTQVCCPTDQVIKDIDPDLCGMSNPGALEGRPNVGGREFNNPMPSEFAEYPWMIALLKKDASGVSWSRDYIGGGTLIHPSVVMTVAHKVDRYNPDQLKCRAGEWDVEMQNELYDHQDAEVRRIVRHNEYIRRVAQNDVALLLLVTPFKLSPHIGVACMGRSLPNPGTTCFSMGWGEDINDGKKYASKLKKIHLPLVSKMQCETLLRRTRLGGRYFVRDSLTCAGGETGNDTCVGDGGSSLVCPLDDVDDRPRYAVYGMVAYGVDCGRPDEPGVYVNVPNMYDWIKNNVEAMGIYDTKFDY